MVIDLDPSTLTPGSIIQWNGSEWVPVNICDLFRFYYPDGDGDGYGTTGEAVYRCEAPEGYADNFDDCNDDYANINPGQEELCDGLDNNCNGEVDEDCPEPDCHLMLVNLLTCAELNCMEGDLTCVQMNCTDMFFALYTSTCIDISCAMDYLDDLSQLNIDETWTKDEIADLIISLCGKEDKDEDGFSPYQGDCNDFDVSVYPGAIDICEDGIDQNCDGHDAIWGDDDGDGYNEEMGDCDNTNPYIYPGAEEICNNIDDDCDGEVDEEGGVEWYIDNDGDGFGNNFAFGVIACEQPEGYTSNSGDCDDNNPSIHPNALEICNGMDDNCNGLVDDDDDEFLEGIPIWYIDEDGDGYGNGDLFVYSCEQPEGFVEQSGDCSDYDPSFNPGVQEICDGKDNDCDGDIDEDFMVDMYLDNDGDGFGSTIQGVYSTCDQNLPVGFVE